MKAKIFIIIVLLCGIIGQAEATSLLLQPGPDYVKDTWIWDSADYSHGGSGELRVNDISAYDQRLLIEFTDLSALAMAQTINSAYLGLYRYSGWNSSGLILDAHQILTPWAETVTYSTQPTFNSAVESSVNITGNGFYEWDVTSLMQMWVDGTAPNYGISVYDHGTSYFQRFVSSDNTSFAPSYRPYLKIDYTPIPEPSTILLLGTSLLGLVVATRIRRKK